MSLSWSFGQKEQDFVVAFLVCICQCFWVVSLHLQIQDIGERTKQNKNLQDSHLCPFLNFKLPNLSSFIFPSFNILRFFYIQSPGFQLCIAEGIGKGTFNSSSLKQKSQYTSLIYCSLFSSCSTTISLFSTTSCML